MRPVGTGVLAILLSLCSVYGADGSSAAGPPRFAEVYELVRTNLPGLSETELNRIAVEGLLTNLGPRVTLLGGNSDSSPAVSPVKKALVLEDNVAYLRVGTVAAGLAASVAQAHEAMNRTCKLVGVVLDLRYAGGDDYATVSDTAALFLSSKRPLLNLGRGPETVSPSEKAVNLPVAVLINRETRGAAEALAAAIRAGAAGLLLGMQTAGVAATSREFILSTGQRLRIATTPVRLADGTPLSPEGVKPDILVPVNPSEEAAFFAEPYLAQPKPSDTASGRETVSTGEAQGTNRVARRTRTSEADLVRARRQGSRPDEDTGTPPRDEPARPQLQDPVLARAVDLLKGLAVVRSGRTP